MSDDRIILALDALRSAALWFTMDALDDNCDFGNSEESDRLKGETRARIDAAIEALTVKPKLSHAARGSNGGAARAAVLSPERRQEIARKAAATRWPKSPQPEAEQ